MLAGRDLPLSVMSALSGGMHVTAVGSRRRMPAKALVILILTTGHRLTVMRGWSDAAAMNVMRMTGVNG